MKPESERAPAELVEPIYKDAAIMDKKEAAKIGAALKVFVDKYPKDPLLRYHYARSLYHKGEADVPIPGDCAADAASHTKAVDRVADACVAAERDGVSVVRQPGIGGVLGVADKCVVAQRRRNGIVKNETVVG